MRVIRIKLLPTRSRLLVSTVEASTRKQTNRRYPYTRSSPRVVAGHVKDLTTPQPG